MIYTMCSSSPVLGDVTGMRKIWGTQISLLRVSGWARSSSALGPPVVCGFLTAQERFHDRSPGDFESMFIKLGGSETRKGLG